MFDRDRFVEECLAAVRQENSHRAVREIVERAVADPVEIFKELGEPKKGGITPIHKSTEITILNVTWPGYMTVQPHNHLMWSVIGVYSGREDNIFWRLLPGDAKSRVEAAGAKALSVGDVVPQGKDIIHSVTNPIPRMTSAIHIYGGDYFATERHEWDPEHLHQRPLDLTEIQRRFQAS
jgi:predicted metal-dependent enzyme (double-stranded beta helix superfamily)